MNIEWTKLRSYNGDQKNAFEELVCQLARAEGIESKQKFVRVAAPDAGVEAYCILDNGDEFGWQAKFFSSMGDSQWNQLKESFETALLKHPRLTRYYICIPLDRADARISSRKSLLDRWNEKVTAWTKIAHKQGRKIEFEYWGDSEIFDRLSKSEHAGRRYYWFGQEEFSDSWFSQKLEESISNLGVRYTPELNFQLPISWSLQGLSRDKCFQFQFDTCFRKLQTEFNNHMLRMGIVELQAEIQEIYLSYNQITSLINQIDFVEVSIIPQDRLTNLLDAMRDKISTLINKLYEYGARKSDHGEGASSIHFSSKHDFEINKLRKLKESILQFREFISSSSVSLSNRPILILSGEAGVGKSHLLADIARNREKRGLYTLLLLGQQFATTEDPWTQMKKLLQLQCDRDTFLGALNTKAEVSGARALIFIDAINEGQGKNIWKDHISGFITILNRFPNIGLVLSLRTSYEELLIPDIDSLVATKLIHSGFSGHEYNASKLFFDNYQIKQPSIPLLHPEFSNPLFLKLFCEGLFKKGLHEIPEGYEGISSILNFYLDVLNEKISDKYNYPRKLFLAHKVLKRIAERIAETNNSYLSYEDAFSFIENLEEAKSILDKSQFFQDLISGGLLTENLYWDKGGNPIEGIYIAYERFSDHLVASYLLEKYLDKGNPKETFSDRNNKLGCVLSDWYSTYHNKGLIEALSIQLPEKIGLELYEVAEHAKAFDPVISGFIESIIWRKKETLSDKQISYINATIGGSEYEKDFIDTILLVTSNPGHYFNSDFLHNVLAPLSMADRDAWWTQLIHDMYPGDSDTPTTIRRIIDWAWIDDIRESLSDESVRLMGQTMIWFLVSCNRTLRDSSTKALICLLRDKIHVLMQLMERFKEINDPYVLQRIYAVAYGCAVRTGNIEILKPFGELVFKLIFNTEEVVPDILLRDYAKGIIEYAVFKGHKFEFDLDRIRPPFRSELPDSFPSNEDIDLYEFDHSQKDFKEHRWGLDRIIRSMTTEYGRGIGSYGDFGRYIFARALSHWNVNVDGLSNLAVQQIVEKYGYDIEKHGRFDQSIGYMGRHSHHEERIGKKYQWIAFHELLARVSDNCTFSYNRDGNNLEPLYDGPWEPFVRDIDPTITLRRNEKKKNAKNWFLPLSYSNWEHSNRDWVHLKDDLLNPIDQVLVVDEHGVEWLVLDMCSDWSEPDPLDEKESNGPKKRLVYDLSSHIVHKEDLPKILGYLENSNLRGCGLSESKVRYEMFSREYYWASANDTFKSEYYGGNNWDNFYDRRTTRKFICKVAKTAIEYLWENEHDHSKDESISFYKPSELVFRLLNLQYTDVEGILANAEREIICFDPSIKYDTPKCLLVRKKDFLDSLDTNNLNVFWSILGEKQVFGFSIEPGEWTGRLNMSDLVYFDSGEFKSSSCYDIEENDSEE